MKFTKGIHLLKERVARCRIPGQWQSFENGSLRQFAAVSDEYLNYWPSTGTITFQGRSDGPLAQRFMKLTASRTRPTPSESHTVKVAPKPLSNLGLVSPHDPMDYGLRRSTRNVDVAALNKRQAQFRSIVAGLPDEAAVAELILSSVRHAADYLSVSEIHEALNTVSDEIRNAGYKWVDLYATIASEFRAEPCDDL